MRRSGGGHVCLHEPAVPVMSASHVGLAPKSAHRMQDLPPPAPLPAQTSGEPACGSPRGADEVFRRSQLQWGTAGQPAAGAPQLRSSRSLAVLERLERPTVQVAERLPAQRQTRLARGPVHRTFAAAEWATGFNRNQLSLGLQVLGPGPMRCRFVLRASALPLSHLPRTCLHRSHLAQTAVSFAAVMFLIFIPSVNAALSHRSVWAVSAGAAGRGRGGPAGTAPRGAAGACTPRPPSPPLCRTPPCIPSPAAGVHHCGGARAAAGVCHLEVLPALWRHRGGGPAGPGRALLCAALQRPVVRKPPAQGAG